MKINVSRVLNKLNNQDFMNIFQIAHFIFPSTLQLSPYIEILIEPISSETSKEKIKLGLHEALINAVQHGNAADYNKPVRVKRIITSKWFIWQIQDEGNGIPKFARESSLPSNIDAESGRGLFLIHHCFEDVRWSPKGNRLQLSFRR